VQRIIRAYDEHKVRVAEQQMSLSLEAKAAGFPQEKKVTLYPASRSEE
jgi:hypothetical protein